MKSILEFSRDLESQVRNMATQKPEYFLDVALKSTANKIYDEKATAFRLCTKTQAPDTAVWERLRDLRDSWLAAEKLAGTMPDLQVGK